MYKPYYFKPRSIYCIIIKYRHNLTFITAAYEGVKRIIKRLVDRPTAPIEILIPPP